jgi:uncharacterized alkaline shock family protein YloU
MTEAQQRQQESPLRSDRGVTNIKDTVVSRIAGMAAGEVEGVRMGGGASRSAGGLLESITGSDSGSTRGVGVEVGTFETAIDLKMGIDYGKNILGTVGEVRQKITERVQNMTGLRVTELNVTISDIVFPEDDRQDEPTAREEPRTTATPGPDFDTRAMRRQESVPPEGDETRRLGVEDEATSDTGASDTETSRADTPDAEAPEAEASDAETARGETAETPASETSDATSAEAPTDETTLTGETDDRTREIEREQAAAAEERRTRRRRRREQREDD